MTTSSPKPVNNYLTSNDQDLQYILTKAGQLEKINHQVNLLLDPTLAIHCRVANIKENTLIIIAANGAIATQLRYQTIDLIKKFKQVNELKQIKSIVCKVSPKLIQQKDPILDVRDKIPLISKETSKIIKEIAEGINHPGLKKAMEKIASHTKETC